MNNITFKQFVESISLLFPDIPWNTRQQKASSYEEAYLACYKSAIKQGGRQEIQIIYTPRMNDWHVNQHIYPDIPVFHGSSALEIVYGGWGFTLEKALQEFSYIGTDDDIIVGRSNILRPALFEEFTAIAPRVLEHHGDTTTEEDEIRFLLKSTDDGEDLWVAMGGNLVLTYQPSTQKWVVTEEVKVSCAHKEYEAMINPFGELRNPVVIDAY